MNHNECLTLRKNYFSTNHSSINTIEENTVNDSIVARTINLNKKNGQTDIIKIIDMS